MNRRTFTKAAIASCFAPMAIKEAFAQDILANQPPVRNGRNDAEFIEWHAQNQVPVPADVYTIRRTINLNSDDQLNMQNSVIRGHVSPLIRARSNARTMITNVRLYPR